MMQKKKRTRILYVIAAALLLTGLLAVTNPVQTQAADANVKIKTCKLTSGGSKVTVKAKVKKKTAAMGSKLYLLALNANKSETKKLSAKPIASVKAKKGTVTLKAGFNSSMLYQKFAVAYKKGSKYQILGDASYLTNPEALATYTGSGPAVTSKKGLQVEDLDDSLSLGAQHVVINWTLNSLLNQKATNQTSFTYKNKTYQIDADQLKKHDEQVQAYNAAGARVTIILLLPKDGASTGTSAMQFGGDNYTLYSSIKTSSNAGRLTFEAIMDFLGKRYGTAERLVSGWILGNEVNSPYIWNYGGNKKLATYMDNYARAFHICYNAVKSVNKNAKVYISLDHNWNNDADGSGKRYFTSKATLDQFYASLKAKGDIDFQIAYHAYPQGMSDPVFWDDSTATNSVNAKIVNFKNLDVLTKYVKKKFGKNCKIMLSEQSFNSSRGEAVQAAAYAYAYYMSEGNSMIEAFIYGREFDHPSETNLGYYWGLCNNARAKRLVWHVFQYIDSKESFTFTDPLLRYTNLKKWNKIKNFKKSKCTKMASKLKKAVITKTESESTTSLKLSWDRINTADGYEIYRGGQLIGTVTSDTTVSYTDKNLTRAGVYQYQMRMYKEAPQSDNPDKRVKIYGTMSDPVSVRVTTGQVEINESNCEVSGNRIKIAWKKMTDVDGYEIYRSTAKDGAYELVGAAAGSKGSYTDSDAGKLSGTVYYYKVRAYITADGVNYYGEFSEPTEKQALIQLTAGIKDNKVVLNWMQWPNAVRYRVFCKRNIDAEYVRVGGIGTNAYSMTKYKDAAGNMVDFVVGVTYCLKVRAVYADDSLSKFSNEVELVITEPIYETEEPSPTEPSPGPEEPSPTEPSPGPEEPSPTEPSPGPEEPSPTEPSPGPEEPSPTEPSPTEPSPTEPSPTEPSPTEPSPTEPSPGEPKTAAGQRTESEPVQAAPAPLRSAVLESNAYKKQTVGKAGETVREKKYLLYLPGSPVYDWDYGEYQPYTCRRAAVASDGRKNG